VKLFGKMPLIFLHVWCGNAGAVLSSGPPPYILTVIILNVRAML